MIILSDFTATRSVMISLDFFESDFLDLDLDLDSNLFSGRRDSRIGQVCDLFYIQSIYI